MNCRLLIIKPTIQKALFFLITVLLTGCDTKQYSASNGGKVTIVGQALNAKLGAAVQTEEGALYIKGLDKWDDEFYGKKVKVSGKLVVKEFEEQGIDSLKATISGPMRIIKRPRWSLVD